MDGCHKKIEARKQTNLIFHTDLLIDWLIKGSNDNNNSPAYIPWLINWLYSKVLVGMLQHEKDVLKEFMNGKK